MKKHVAINTDPISLETDSNNAIATRLKERYVKHIRIKDSSELQVTYNFGEQIGRGGFGSVISVIDKTTNKDWAMKIVSKAAVGTRIETVYREITILKMVDHPHIIYLDKVYESARKIYLILELCYSTLSKVLREEKAFSESDTKKIICDLASAIAYLHKNDIVHRDLKLDNILIAKNPNDSGDRLYIKVSDFGLSIVKQGSGYENMLHECCGTILFMAPEVITTRSYSQQCDVWAIGIIMYALLAGHYPFYSRNEQDLTTKICKNEPSFTEFQASPAAIHLITKMLAKNPALRITAGEVIHHPWTTGKPMTRDSDLPGNVLDMMRLWRSEMMLPVGADCDWVSSANAIANAAPITSPVFNTAHITTRSPEENFEDPATDVLGTIPRKQSMHLPVKNIRFERPTNQNTNVQGTGRRTSKTVGVEEPRTNRSSSSPAPPITQASSRPTSFIPKLASMPESSGTGKSHTPKTPDKG